MDPVQQDVTDGKWYFWNEVWADRHGPFDTEELCREGIRLYCAFFLEGAFHNPDHVV